MMISVTETDSNKRIKAGNLKTIVEAVKILNAKLASLKLEPALKKTQSLSQQN